MKSYRKIFLDSNGALKFPHLKKLEVLKERVKRDEVLE
jgi:hypothetical protein